MIKTSIPPIFFFFNITEEKNPQILFDPPNHYWKAHSVSGLILSILLGSGNTEILSTVQAKPPKSTQFTEEAFSGMLSGLDFIWGRKWEQGICSAEKQSAQWLLEWHAEGAFNTSQCLFPPKQETCLDDGQKKLGGTFKQKSQTALLVSLGNDISSRKLQRIVAILAVPNSLSINQQQ